MLQYTFSTREKVMLVLLIVVGLGVAWFQLLFKPIQNQISSLDAQIASTQDEIVLRQANSASLEQMRAVVESYQAQGLPPVVLPNYDNTQQLMAYLNGVLVSTAKYDISFDTPAIGEDGTVHRTGNISFTTDTYETARTITELISRGPYPCNVVTLGITDKNADENPSGAASERVTCNLSVTFLERVTADADLEEEGSKTPEGQDLSVLTNWNDQ